MKIFKKTVLLASMALSFSFISACNDSSNGSKNVKQTSYNRVTFAPIGTFLHGGFDESAAEITAFHPESKRGFVVNAQNKKVDVLDLTDPTAPKSAGSLDVSSYAGSVNSVAVHGNLVALAVEAKTKTDNGYVAIFDANSLKALGKVMVGALPDMVTFTPDGKKVLSANEGEPNNEYTIDPEGSISIVDVTDTANLKVTHVDFKNYIGKEADLNKKGVRISGKNANAAQDLEPEYITVSEDGKTAFVSLQENNAIAVVNVEAGTLTDIKPLGYKDHSKAGNELDPSNKDEKINIANFPVFGMYQPDAIASYTAKGKTYLVTANEGDGREYEYEDNKGKDQTSFVDESKVSKLNLDETAFKGKCGDLDCADKKALGSLKVTTTMGDTDGDGDYDELYAYGARSFSIWDTSDMSKPVYDSGSELAKLIAQKYPKNFNASNDDNDLDDRSDNKGAEPEGVTIGKVGNQTIAFVGLERISSVVAYDVTDPTHAKLLGEINTRTFNDDKLKAAEKGTDGAKANHDGDLGPEGLTFIPADKSPNGKPLLFVGFEVSGTSRIFELDFAE